MSLIAVNIAIFLIIGCSVLKLAWIKTRMAEQRDSPNIYKCNKCTDEILDIVPHQVTAFQAYSSFTLDLTRLISKQEENQFTYNLFNELQPVQRRINRFLTLQTGNNQKNLVPKRKKPSHQKLE